jgi:hypothetical protein
MPFYNNLPPNSQIADSANSTLKVFDAYTTAPLDIDSATYDAMTGFFASRGFAQDSAKSMAYIVIKQAILDGYQPFELVNNLKDLSSIELTTLITEIVNFNRYKTSSLGTATPFAAPYEIKRNILA